MGNIPQQKANSAKQGGLGKTQEVLPEANATACPRKATHHVEPPELSDHLGAALALVPDQLKVGRPQGECALADPLGGVDKPRQVLHKDSFCAIDGPACASWRGGLILTQRQLVHGHGVFQSHGVRGRLEPQNFRIQVGLLGGL